MENIFHVKIHYDGNVDSELNIIAADDAEARTAALAWDAEVYETEGVQIPKVKFCEITFVCEAVR